MADEHPYGVKIKTRKAAADIETWVEESASGDYSITVQDILDDGRKAVAVFFASEADRDAFKAAYQHSKGKSA